MKKFELARRAVADLQEIWEFVSEHSFAAADRLLGEFDTTFGQLAEMPGLGHKRVDLSRHNVLFWGLYSYLIIYKPTQPLRIVRVIHANRHLKRILNQ